MNDYRTKRRYRQRKLSQQGYYDLRQQRSRARRRAEASPTRGISSVQKIAHPENLIEVYNDLKRKAGHAAGLDGVTYDQLSRREVAGIMRNLSKEILDGTYEPSRARHIKILKSDGRSYRTLKIRSITYRVVAKALADALTPFFDRMFLSGSHGFRPRRSPMSMLIAMERIVSEQERFVVAQDDIKQAFDDVSIKHVMTLHRRYIQNPGLLNLIEVILLGHRSEHRTIGIDQGSAYSPLTLNVSLHHVLDFPFSEDAANPPWLRYADNLVYLTRSVSEGLAATRQAQDLLTPIGMTPKDTDGPPTDLRQKGQPVEILGFYIRWNKGHLRYGLGEKAWESLAQGLLKAHKASNPPLMAEQVTRSWIAAGGPAFEGRKENPLLSRILWIAHKAGFREIPWEWLKAHVQSARDRWVALKERAHRLKADREEAGATAPPTADPTGRVWTPEAEIAGGAPPVISAHF